MSDTFFAVFRQASSIEEVSEDLQEILDAIAYLGAYVPGFPQEGQTDTWQEIGVIIQKGQPTPQQLATLQEPVESGVQNQVRIVEIP